MKSRIKSSKPALRVVRKGVEHAGMQRPLGVLGVLRDVHHAFEGLHAFALAFHHVDTHHHSVAGGEIGDGFAQAGDFFLFELRELASLVLLQFLGREAGIQDDVAHQLQELVQIHVR